jgi:(p)ppGpp synthase/HD superfamily hydrolase
MTMDDGFLLNAVRFADAAHSGQRRKWSNTPYIVHPMRVMCRMMLHPLGDDLNVLCAAVCHDVLEDCPAIGWGDIVSEIGLAAAHIVEELTNPSKQHPELSRVKAKQLDREHLRTCSVAARAIKLADRADNLRDMGRDAPPWKIDQYREESRLLAECLKGTDRDLEAELAALLIIPV